MDDHREDNARVAAIGTAKETGIRIVRRMARAAIDLYLRIASRAPGHSLRIAALRLAGARIGRNVALGRGAIAIAPRFLDIGPNTIIGPDLYLDARGGLSIGANCNISAQSCIWTAEHAVQSPDFAMTLEAVRIGDRVWLGFRSTILPGVTIGDGAVVASGAVVIKDIPPFAIAGGVPAKVIGRRSEDLHYTLGRRRH